jgi:hypothetical protein
MKITEQILRHCAQLQTALQVFEQHEAEPWPDPEMHAFYARQAAETRVLLQQSQQFAQQLQAAQQACQQYRTLGGTTQLAALRTSYETLFVQPTNPLAQRLLERKPAPGSASWACRACALKLAQQMEKALDVYLPEFFPEEELSSAPPHLW